MRVPGLALLLVVALVASADAVDWRGGRGGSRISRPARRDEGAVPRLPDAAPLLAGAVRRWRRVERRPPRRPRPRPILARGLRNRFVSIAVLLVAVTALGTAGYMLIEGWSAFDSLYMTVITVASVGFNEVHPLSTEGRAFTMGLIVVGLGSVAYGLSTITAFWVEGNLLHLWENRKMERRISDLRNHIIVCGGGETGRHIAQELMRTTTPFVVIDVDPRQETALQKFGRDMLYIIGDATDSDVLRTAGMETARGLIASMPSDKDNLFTLLTAREINPKARLVSGVSADDARSKLLRAGADAVVSGKAIGALRLASEMLRPRVVSFLDAMLREPGATRVQEIAVGPGAAGRSLAALKLQERVGIVVFAVVSARTQRHLFNPPPETGLELGDLLIACASHAQLEAATKLAS